MELPQIKKLQEHAQEIAKILYEDTDPERLKTLEEIEKIVREQLLTHIDPEIGNFLSKKVAEQPQEEKDK